MTYRLNNIKSITIKEDWIEVQMEDGTKQSIKRSNEEIKFIKDLVNTNNAPITDHCI